MNRVGGSPPGPLGLRPELPCESWQGYPLPVKRSLFALLIPVGFVTLYLQLNSYLLICRPVRIVRGSVWSCQLLPHLASPTPSLRQGSSFSSSAGLGLLRCRLPQFKWPHSSASLYLLSHSALYPPVLFFLLHVFLCITNSAPNLLAEFKNSHFRPAPQVICSGGAALLAPCLGCPGPLMVPAGSPWDTLGVISWSLCFWNAVFPCLVVYFLVFTEYILEWLSEKRCIRDRL